MAVEIGRRELLGAGVAAALSLVAAGCGDSSDKATDAAGSLSSPSTTPASGPVTATGAGPSASATASSGVYPAYQPVTGITPDAPAVGDGLALFLNYPKGPAKFVDQAPGEGGGVSAFVSLNGATAPVKSPRWDELNRRLNVKMSFNAVIPDDFNAKLATIVAGGEFPDIVQLQDGALPNLPELLERRFADLTPYLSGDAVKDYPALANIPTPSWRSCVYGGKLYAVPQTRGLLTNGMLYRRDVLAQRGLPTTIKTGEEFLSLCKELTDERKSEWAIAYAPGMMLMFEQMYGVPNVWQVDDGEFTSAYETDQIKEALSATNAMWKSGVMNPDSWAAPFTSVWAWFFNGTVPIFPGINWGNITAYTSLAAAKGKPPMDLDLFGPASTAGHTAKYWTGPGYWGYSAIKQAEPDRVKELLRIMNYLASPFGSEEWLFNNYGLAGADYELQGSNPVAKSGLTDTIPVGSITNATSVMYRAGLDTLMKRAYAYQTAWLAAPYETQDPSVGLASATLLKKGPSLTKVVSQAMIDVAQGRKPLSAWDSVVKTWRDSGGADAKKELSQAWHAAHQ